MSISYQAKGDAQLAQQLKVQELNLVLTAAQVNAATAIDFPLFSLTGAAATRLVTVKCGEAVAQIVSVSINNQTTGAIVALAAAPAIAATSTITTTIDASAVAVPLVVCVKYVVVE